MLTDNLEKLTGLKYDSARYRGFSGWIRFVAVLWAHTTVYLYVILTACALPLYVNEYSTLGTGKATFWMQGYQFCGKLLIVVPILLFISFVGGVIAYYDDEDEDRSLLDSGYVIPDLKEGTISSVHIWTLLFMAGAVISFYLSEYKNIAVSGERGWYLGMQQYMVFGVCVFLIAVLRCREYIFMMLILLTSFAVSAAGIIMDLFGNVFHIEDWSEGKVSTMGNANWFCGYLVTVVFIGVALYFTKKDEHTLGSRILKALLAVYLFVCFMMYIAQGSLSGFVALYGVFLTLSIIAGEDLEKLLRISEMSVIFSFSAFVNSLIKRVDEGSRANDAFGALMSNSVFTFIFFVLMLALMIFILCRKRSQIQKARFNYGRILLIMTGVSLILYLMVLVINTIAGGKLIAGNVFYLSPGWGSNRGETISVGLRLFDGMGFREKMFGKGPDTFYSFLTGGRFPVLSREVSTYFGGARLTNAHCEPVTMLVNVGIVGTVTFYGMLVSVLIKIFKMILPGIKKGSGNGGIQSGNGFLLGTALCIMAYIINNLFSFQTPMNISQLALILGFGAAAVCNGSVEEK